MDATPEEPEKLRLIVRVNKTEAAMAQLDSAIWIWFHHGDWISIHTLAAAAHDCFAALVSHRKGKTMLMRAWYKEQSQAKQDQIRKVRNFFKHGLKDLKGEVRLPIFYTLMVMFDCVIYCGNLTPITPLMRAYAIRFCIENRDVMKRDLSYLFTEGIKIEDFVELDRTEFMNKILPILSRGWTPPSF
jgi:hypothetical protein